MPPNSCTPEELIEVFPETLGRGTSRSMILIAYHQDEQVRWEVGFPYSISRKDIEIGPYLKDIVTSPPRDYDNRKRKIPISDIVSYRRVELSDVL